MSTKIFLTNPEQWMAMRDDEKAEAFTDAMRFAAQLANDNEWLATQLRRVDDLLDKVNSGGMPDDDFVDALTDISVDWIAPARYALIRGAK